MRCLLVIPVLAGLMFPPLASAQHARAFQVPRPGVSQTSVERGAARARRNFIEAQSKSPVISKAGGAFSVVTPFQVQTRAAWEAPAPRLSLGRELGKGRAHNRELIFINASPFGYPLSYSNNYDPAMFYPSLWPPIDQQYLQARQIANGDVGGEAAPPQSDLLSSQIEALTSEIESLRQQSFGPAPAAPQAAVPARANPAVFVYRDGRSVEAHNYAIFNQTLWVFGSEGTLRIPLSEINVPATLKLNRDRGIDIILPGAH